MTMYLSDYQTFNSTQELNHHVRQHEHAHADLLTASHRQVLRFIARYAVKYSGASHLKTSTIAEGVDKSERTVRRILAVLERLNVIKRIQTTRPKTGGSGANIIVVQPCASNAVTAKVSTRVSDREHAVKTRQDCDNTPQTGNEPLHKQSQELLHKTNTDALSQPSKSPYLRFKSLISDQQLRNKIYGIWLAQTSYIREHYDEQTLVDIGIQALMITFKSGKARSKTSYYNGVLDKLLDSLYYDELRALHS